MLWFWVELSGLLSGALQVFSIVIPLWENVIYFFQLLLLLCYFIYSIEILHRKYGK